MSLETEFDRAGFYGPLPALDVDALARIVDEIGAAEAMVGESLSTHPDQLRAKSHLILPEINKLIRLPPYMGEWSFY
ncbi:MAG: hypothetical protein AAF493_27030, partial [Pseudomonadota bacterium]